ncbi:hypothetical protein NQ318_004977 [Aromia moschata]|uniref:Suppressor of fused homolog n=1 Tax=Aromia moschata TaxID=1265417 RepID=A0AAV8X5R7_9CUCU|nr:hypothetical protein NQ318_004977 [Aromia moschata]
MDEAASLPHGPPMNILPPTPAGLESLYALCRKIYPDQVNPLQVTALLKYWLGGPDPLDYVSMYSNPGAPHENIPPHWHYISFGLSDLHGDGRVHDVSGPEGVSGFGFELTFRLRREPGETEPPTWPATLMQSLAKYVFQSGNTLCSRDHVTWHCALDNSESRIQHMLMTTDIQLKTAHTPFGSVEFIQIVGICAEELKAAQQWNGAGILDMITRIPADGNRTGSSKASWRSMAHNGHAEGGKAYSNWTSMRRKKSKEVSELGGSSLSGVSARCSWAEQDASNVDIAHLKDKSDENNEDLKLKSRVHQSLQGNQSALESAELVHVKKLEGVHLIFNLEAGSLLPLAIRGRVKHGRHFTFESILGETAITLVAHSVTGTLVDSNILSLPKVPGCKY